MSMTKVLIMAFLMVVGIFVTLYFFDIFSIRDAIPQMLGMFMVGK